MIDDLLLEVRKDTICLGNKINFKKVSTRFGYFCSGVVVAYNKSKTEFTCSVSGGYVVVGYKDIL